MGTRRPDEDDEVELDARDDAALADALDDEVVGRETAPVIESGGGVAEGFEESEALLIENATLGAEDGTLRILEDAGEVEAEPDRAVYGEADHEHTADEED